MKITVGTNTIKKMIEGYYKEVYNFSGKATIKVTSNDDYYGPSFNTQVLLTGKVKVLEGGNAIFNQIKSFAMDEDYGDPRDYDIKITKIIK